MKQSFENAFVGFFVIGAVFTGALAFHSLLTRDSYVTPVMSVPGLDGRDERSKSAPKEAEVIIGEYFEKLSDASAKTEWSNWPRFRGKDFSNIVSDSVELPERLPDDGLPVLWEIETGEGHAAPIIVNGRVYFLDYDEQMRADILRCFLLEDGQELWRRGYRVKVKRNHGISRTVPAYSDGKIVTIGPRCHVMCVDAENGNFIWGLDLEKDFGTDTPLWFTGQCPLIENGEAILAPGGNALLIGINLETGSVNWRTPNPAGWKMSHSSVVPITIHGRRMFVYSAIGATVGVSAELSDRGTLLWHTSEWAPKVVAPSPILLPGNRIFMTAGYGSGSFLFGVNKKDDGFFCKTLSILKPKEGLCSEQQTPLLYNEVQPPVLFGVLPKDAGGLRKQLVCASSEDPSEIVFNSGKEKRYGLGPYMIINDRLLVLDDDGILTMFKLEGTGFEELFSTVLFEDGKDAWGPFAYSDGLLLLRDSTRLMCVDLRKKK